MNFIMWAQEALTWHGHDLGAIDGIWGRRTWRALLAFQHDNQLPQTGTFTQATIHALQMKREAHHPPPQQNLWDIFPWMAAAIYKYGLQEQRTDWGAPCFLKASVKSLGDPTRLPWCGDFVETCLALTLPNLPLPTNPYIARNWLQLGHTVDACFGSVLIFWRGSRFGKSGHVGFYYSEDKDNYHVLGGNQNNRIGISKVSKSRLLGARLPDFGGPYYRQRVFSQSDWNIKPTKRIVG